MRWKGHFGLVGLDRDREWKNFSADSVIDLDRVDLQLQLGLVRTLYI